MNPYDFYDHQNIISIMEILYLCKLLQAQVTMLHVCSVAGHGDLDQARRGGIGVLVWQAFFPYSQPAISCNLLQSPAISRNILSHDHDDQVTWASCQVWIQAEIVTSNDKEIIVTRHTGWEWSWNVLMISFHVAEAGNSMKRQLAVHISGSCDLTLSFCFPLPMLQSKPIRKAVQAAEHSQQPRYSGKIKQTVC